MHGPARVLVSVCCLLLLTAAAVRGAAGPRTLGRTRQARRPPHRARPGVEVLALPPQDQEYVALTAGRYALPLPPFWTTDVDVPDGWSVFAGHYLSAGPVGSGAPGCSSTTRPPGPVCRADPCSDHAYRTVGPSCARPGRGAGAQPFVRAGRPLATNLGRPAARGRSRVAVPPRADVGDCRRWLGARLQASGRPTTPGAAATGGAVRLWVAGPRRAAPRRARRERAGVLRRPTSRRSDQMVRSITFQPARLTLPTRTAVDPGHVVTRIDRSRVRRERRLAEDRGFEPLRALTQPAFQASAIGH